MYRSALTIKAGLAALALGGAVLTWSPPADAGSSTGTWRNGMQAGPVGPGYYGPGGRYYGHPRSYGRRGYDDGPGYRRRGYDGYREESVYGRPYGRGRGYYRGYNYDDD